MKTARAFSALAALYFDFFSVQVSVVTMLFVTILPVMFESTLSLPLYVISPPAKLVVTVLSLFLRVIVL